MKQSEMINQLINLNKQVVKAMQANNDAIRALNDSSVLHARNLAKNTEAIDRLVASNQKIMQVITAILFLLVGAVVILAGAEKALRIWGL